MTIPLFLNCRIAHNAAENPLSIMVSKKIKSLQHPFVKHCVRLRKEKAYRHEQEEVFVTGKKIIEQISKSISPTQILSIFDINGDIQVTEEIMRKITGLRTPDGTAAIFPLPQIDKGKKKEAILVLDRIQDPGNLGILLRTACALRFDEAVLTPETVDPFNDKAIRASSGASFLLPFHVKSEKEIIEWIQKDKIPAYIADLKGTAADKLKVKKPFFLVLSHEGQGAASWLVKLSQKVNIPIQKKIESLNVASAGSILMYEMMKEEA